MAGADFGFMSTTLDQGVALHYSKGREASAASTVLAIQACRARHATTISKTCQCSWGWKVRFQLWPGMILLLHADGRGKPRRAHRFLVPN